jgi:hypothetical protein
MSVIIFFSASKKIFFCRNDVQAIDFLRKGSYAPGIRRYDLKIVFALDRVILSGLLQE